MSILKKYEQVLKVSKCIISKSNDHIKINHIKKKKMLQKDSREYRS